MSETLFHYRLDGGANGRRPGAHAGRHGGAGHEFLGHARLFDHPDPRRLDLRASLRAGREEWLVRTHRQRTAIAVHAVVDVSASMACGTPRKLDVAADFTASMAESAFATGDSAGLIAFDGVPREDLYQPAQHHRMAGQVMSAMLRQARPAGTRGCGLAASLRPLAGRQAMVFLVSDFHWPLAQIAEALDLLARAWVVPLVVWDGTEAAPPPANAFVRLRDAESGQLRSLWLTPGLRRQWQQRIADRRRELGALFATRNLRPLYLCGAFEAAALSQYFIEGERA